MLKPSAGLEPSCHRLQGLGGSLHSGWPTAKTGNGGHNDHTDENGDFSSLCEKCFARSSSALELVWAANSSSPPTTPSPQTATGITIITTKEKGTFVPADTVPTLSKCSMIQLETVVVLLSILINQTNGVLVNPTQLSI